MRTAERRAAAHNADTLQREPAASRSRAGQAFFEDRRPQALRLQRLASLGAPAAAGVAQREREQVVVPRANAEIRTGLMQKNVKLAPGDLLEVDFDQEAGGRVPVFANGKKVGTIQSSAVSRKLVAGKLPPGTEELDSVVLDVAVLKGDPEEARVETEKALVARYRVPAGGVLHHGTYADSVDSILSSGLDPNYGGKSGGSDYDHWAANCKGYVYLTPNGEKAALDLIKNFWLGQGTKDEPHTRKNLPAFAALKITAPEGGLEMEADPDLSGVSLRTKTLIKPAWMSRSTTTQGANEDQ